MRYLMGLIKFKKKVPEELIELLGAKVNRWLAIQKMMETEGWKILNDEISKEIKLTDSVRNVSQDKLQETIGRVDGLEFPLIRIHDFERAADEARVELDNIAAQIGS